MRLHLHRIAARSARHAPVALGCPVLLALLLGGCDRAAGDTTTEDLREQTVVAVVAVGRGAVERLETSIGRVETFSAPQVSAEVDGRIVSVRVDVGDEVQQGEILAHIDSEPFELRLGSARADRARLEVERSQWERDLERMESVAEEGYVSESEIENARSELGSIDAQLESVGYQEQEAENDLRRTAITSPVSGQIDSRDISEGDYIAIGDQAFTVSPLTAYRVSLSFPQSMRGVLERGQRVRLYPADSPHERAEGLIARIRPSVDGGSRSLVAVVDFDDPGGWRPGMTVTGEVVVESRSDALRVPRLSVVQRPAGTVVYVFDGETVSQREIGVGHQTADWVEVESGLRQGERIVTDGAQFLTDGARVRVRDADS